MLGGLEFIGDLEVSFGLQVLGLRAQMPKIIIIIITIITAIELLLGGSSPYTSTERANKNKYT